MFATSASRASSRDAARERARPGAERRHATTATERRVVVDARGVVPCPDVARVARSSRAISSERKLAIDSSVGWSNNAVGARSALNHAASVLTNSVVAIESRPADMSGAFISTTVPMTSRATARTSSRASIRRHVARPGLADRERSHAPRGEVRSHAPRDVACPRDDFRSLRSSPRPVLPSSAAALASRQWLATDAMARAIAQTSFGSARERSPPAVVVVVGSWTLRAGTPDRLRRCTYAMPKASTARHRGP